MHQAEPERVDWARELALSLKLSAQVQAALGAREKAKGHYQEGLNLYGGLMAVQPANQDLANDAGEIRRALDGLGEREPGCVAAP